MKLSIKLTMLLCCTVFNTIRLHAVAVANETEPEVYRPSIKVGYAPELTLKDAFNSPRWEQVPSYTLLEYIRELEQIDRAPSEPGKARFLYNDNYFFARVDMVDSDVLTAAKTNHGPHFMEGDLVEIFLKPENDKYYWELYGTPNKHYTRFYFPARGVVGLPSGFAVNDTVLGVEVKIDGTFNKSGDKDKGWSIIIAVPRTELEKNGMTFGPENGWRLLCARYNYSAYLHRVELSSYPQASKGFHSTHYYATVEFINLDTEKK